MSELNTTMVHVMYMFMMESVIHGYNEYKEICGYCQISVWKNCRACLKVTQDYFICELPEVAHKNCNICFGQ